MRIDSIECFRVLAETLNYTDAAHRLHMTQSALTRSIQQMEEKMGVLLFDRSRRSVTLTPAGYSFLADSKRMLESYHESVENAKNAARGIHGLIRFGAHIYSLNAVTLDIIQAFQKENKNISWKIIGADSAQMIYFMEEESIDCAIGTSESGNRNVETILLKQYRNCVVLPPNHNLAAKEAIRFEELRGERFFVISQHTASKGYDDIRRKAREAGFDPYIDVKADSVSHLMVIVAAGEGITILSENYRVQAYDKLKFIPLADESMVNLNFMWNRQNKNPCVQLLAEFVREKFRKKLHDGIDEETMQA